MSDTKAPTPLAISSAQGDGLPALAPSAYLKAPDPSGGSLTPFRRLDIDKKLSITRRVLVGTDIDNLALSMAQEAREKAGHDIYTKVIECSRGVAVLTLDPTQMNVSITYRFEAPMVENTAQVALDLSEVMDEFTRKAMELCGIQPEMLEGPNKDVGEQ